MVALLLDIDGVLYVGDEPLPGAVAALERLRQLDCGLRLVTNTTSKSRREIVAHLNELGFQVEAHEVLTPAAMAVRHCRERGHERVSLLVADGLREDLGELREAAPGDPADAVVLGDLRGRLTEDLMNAAFRLLMDGSELIALQHNRYFRRADGIVLDVGAWAAALEYATGREAAVVGKPAAAFFSAAVADLPVSDGPAVMVGDDIEADIGGALAAGLRGVLVCTGKYRRDIASASGVEPTATVDSIADLPDLISGWA
ncbi:MAG: TIGR01458 family HAD-type hydrolase [Thermoleophilaceae bacterium]